CGHRARFGLRRRCRDALVSRRFGGIYFRYISDGVTLMSNTGIAKIFMHGRSQAVRLPLAFRLPGDRVRVRRVERGVLLEPMVSDIDDRFGELDGLTDVALMVLGRLQPTMNV